MLMLKMFSRGRWVLLATGFLWASQAALFHTSSPANPFVGAEARAAEENPAEHATAKTAEAVAGNADHGHGTEHSPVDVEKVANVGETIQIGGDYVTVKEIGPGKQVKLTVKGHPSSPITWQTDLALWSLIVFVIFVAVLKKFAWQPLIMGLDRRESKIRHDIEAADAARIKSEQMLAEHATRMEKVQDEIREILAEARRDAEHTKQEILAAAQKESDESRKRAVEEIELVRNKALEDLFSHMANTVAQATEHVLGRTLTDGDQDRLVDEALAGFASQRH
ncbi:MAG TPA: F0F1 ATP synthase subunit B [Planctomycetaceae bacterium]|nr:F0F1 ATP synthase subunit B [Planctomycetaceae bacterium]